MILTENDLALLFLKPGYSDRPDVIAAMEGALNEMAFAVVAQGTFQFDRETAEAFYSHKQGAVWFNTHTHFITSGPVRYYVVAPSADLRSDFYQQTREVAKMLRDEFGRKNARAKKRLGANTAHASESSKDALRELSILGLLSETRQ